MVKLATGLRLTALFAAVAGVLFSLIAATMSDPQTAAGMLTVSTDDMNASGLPLVLRVVVTVTPAVTFAYAMWQLARLLKLAAEGNVFSPPAAAYLRSFGVWLLVTTLLQVSLGFVVKGLYLWLSAAEHGRLDLTLNSSNLWNLFISALFMLVARVLADAYVIAEENRQIV